VDPKGSGLSEDTPLRLDAAVKAAFPAGGMTVAGLKKEIARGNLQVEKIAGKLFTTLGAIARMRELCRVAPKSFGLKSHIIDDPLDVAIAQARLFSLLKERPHGATVPRANKRGAKLAASRKRAGTEGEPT
jgi:hypothetical protein